VFDRAALPETVQDAGICIDHTLVNDQKYVHSFVRAVSDLFNDNTKRSQLSERAIRLVRENYHWSHVTDRLLSYL
jgi:glycosyltransferase involved in cell wall biosynthesis